MKMRHGLMFVALLGFILPGCKPSEQAQAEKAAVEAEMKALEGKWKIASREGTQSEDEDGTEKPEAEATYYYILDKDILREEYKDKDGKIEVISRRKITVVPSKTPKTIDLVYVDENGKEIKERSTKKGITGKKKTTTTVLKDVGIYKLEGTKLELCISWDEKNRPTDFTAPMKSSRYLVKLEKVTE